MNIALNFLNKRKQYHKDMEPLGWVLTVALHTIDTGGRVADYVLLFKLKREGHTEKIGKEWGVTSKGRLHLARMSKDHVDFVAHYKRIKQDLADLNVNASEMAVMEELGARGLTSRELGESMKISRQRVHQIRNLSPHLNKDGGRIQITAQGIKVRDTFRAGEP